MMDADLHRTKIALGMMKRLQGRPIEEPHKIVGYYISDVEALLARVEEAREVAREYRAEALTAFLSSGHAWDGEMVSEHLWLVEE
jgi:hypothetical protein